MLNITKIFNIIQQILTKSIEFCVNYVKMLFNVSYCTLTLSNLHVVVVVEGQGQNNDRLEINMAEIKMKS